MSKSIYISVPSVEDKEIFNIVEQVFDEADCPDDIYLGICHSVPFNNKKSIEKIKNKITRKNISNKFINFYRKMGVGYGRKVAISMYSEQDYVLQIDGHTNFTKSWDSQIIDMYKSVPKTMVGDKYLLTAYLPGYQIINNNIRISPDDYIPRYPAFLSKNNIGKGEGLDEVNMNRDSAYPHIPRWLSLKSISEPVENSRPRLLGELNNVENFLNNGYSHCRKINANFIFSDKKIIEDYDKIYLWNFLFLEEEFIASIEAFNLGYNFIFPNFKLPLAHLYFDWYNEFYDKDSRKSVEPDYQRLIKAQNKISLYMSQKENQQKIKKYCEYAGLTYPEFESIDTFYIPGENNA